MAETFQFIKGNPHQGEVFIKIANNQTWLNDRYTICEILVRSKKSKREFPLTPKVLNKFEWEGSSLSLS